MPHNARETGERLLYYTMVTEFWFSEFRFFIIVFYVRVAHCHVARFLFPVRFCVCSHSICRKKYFCHVPNYSVFVRVCVSFSSLPFNFHSRCWAILRHEFKFSGIKSSLDRHIHNGGTRKQQQQKTHTQTHARL